ncbi:hypothetical protein, partial [Photobacterium phosphoreum]|uniref:hypothetical protein n=1 Tax=Photobacterium phosphoreum TaxID=659 RepID=UPI0024322FDD
ILRIFYPISVYKFIKPQQTKVQALAEKYAVTYADVAQEIKEIEGSLSSLIDELTGNEFDMKGLNEFQSFLKGASDE